MVVQGVFSHMACDAPSSTFCNTKPYHTRPHYTIPNHGCATVDATCDHTIPYQPYRIPYHAMPCHTLEMAHLAYQAACSERCDVHDAPALPYHAIHARHATPVLHTEDTYPRSSSTLSSSFTYSHAFTYIVMFFFRACTPTLPPLSLSRARSLCLSHCHTRIHTPRAHAVTNVSRIWSHSKHLFNHLCFDLVACKCSALFAFVV